MIRSRLLSQIPGLIVAMSDRTGGVSPAPFGMNLSFRVGDAEENVQQNRAIFFGRLGINESELVVPGQIHGTAIRSVNTPGPVEACDGLITDRAGLYLCVTTADCMPVTIVDQRRRVVAALHAGWRGTVGDIVGRAVEILVTKYGSDPADLLAYLGPAAGGCCYAVGEEVAAQFPSEAVETREGKTFVHLGRANMLQLRNGGVTDQRMEASPLCTICTSERFHSYRRDGSRSGRMMAVAGFSPSP